MGDVASIIAAIATVGLCIAAFRTLRASQTENSETVKNVEKLLAAVSDISSQVLEDKMLLDNPLLLSQYGVNVHQLIHEHLTPDQVVHTMVKARQLAREARKQGIQEAVLLRTEPYRSYFAHPFSKAAWQHCRKALSQQTVDVIDAFVAEDDAPLLDFFKQTVAAAHGKAWTDAALKVMPNRDQDPEVPPEDV